MMAPVFVKSVFHDLFLKGHGNKKRHNEADHPFRVRHISLRCFNTAKIILSTRSSDEPSREFHVFRF